MRILFFHQYFKTPKEGGGIRSWYIANALIEQGHSVEVISIGERTEIKTYHNERLKVRYLAIKYSNSLSFWARIYAFTKYLWLARMEARKLDFDMVYAISVPLSTGLLAIWTKKPYVFEVGDLWPEVPIQMNIIKNPLLKFYSRYLEKKIYSQASLIVSLSKDIQRHIFNKNPFKPNYIIPNICDPDIFKPGFDQAFLLQNLNYEDKIVCSYVGTAGQANDLGQMIELAKLAEIAAPDILFIFMINGRDEAKLRGYKLSNIHFIEYSGKNEVARLLAITHFNFVCYAQYPLLGTGSPNKFFDGLASGCITIINVKGWIANLIAQNDCGLFWNVNNSDSLIADIIDICKSKSRLNILQKNSLKLSKSFDKNFLMNRLSYLIDTSFK